MQFPALTRTALTSTEAGNTLNGTIAANNELSTTLPTSGILDFLHLEFIKSTGVPLTEAEINTDVASISLSVNGVFIYTDIPPRFINMLNRFYMGERGYTVTQGILPLVFNRSSMYNGSVQGLLAPEAGRGVQDVYTAEFLGLVLQGLAGGMPELRIKLASTVTNLTGGAVRAYVTRRPADPSIGGNLGTHARYRLLTPPMASTTVFSATPLTNANNAGDSRINYLGVHFELPAGRSVSRLRIYGQERDTRRRTVTNDLIGDSPFRVHDSNLRLSGFTPQSGYLNLPFCLGSKSVQDYLRSADYSSLQFDVTLDAATADTSLRLLVEEMHGLADPTAIRGA